MKTELNSFYFFKTVNENQDSVWSEIHSIFDLIRGLSLAVACRQFQFFDTLTEHTVCKDKFKS